MRISDWSSDVCSSDLDFREGRRRGAAGLRLRDRLRRLPRCQPPGDSRRQAEDLRARLSLRLAGRAVGDAAGDRKSVVSGKSGSVRVDLGGRRIIKKKKKENEKI